LLLIIFPDGFFDAGMLLQALKARHVQFETTTETRASERAAQAQARRRDIGKKLRLIDY
jgi:carnitine O-acetyltransferase